MVVSQASQTSYLEVLQNVLVENVFNIHGLLTVIVGGTVSFSSLSCLSYIFKLRWYPLGVHHDLPFLQLSYCGSRGVMVKPLKTKKSFFFNFSLNF